MALKINSDNYHKYICSLDFYKDFIEKSKEDLHINLEMEGEKVERKTIKTSDSSSRSGPNKIAGIFPKH